MTTACDKHWNTGGEVYPDPDFCPWCVKGQRDELLEIVEGFAAGRPDWDAVDRVRAIAKEEKQ